MREYSEDSFGAHALNWVMIAGAALLFVLASFSNLAPTKSAEASPQKATAAVERAHHA